MIMGKKGTWLAAMLFVVWLSGMHHPAYAQQILAAAKGEEKKSLSLSQLWENKTFTRYTFEEDIKDTFRAIAKIMDIAITFGDDITDTVTMEFKEMPLKEAFDFLITQYDLAYSEDAHSVHIYKPGRGGTQDALIALDNLDAEEARVAMERFGLMRREIKMVFDQPTNCIFVTGPARDIANIQRVIRALETSKKKRMQGKPEIRYFPLKYAKVGDTTMSIGKTTVTVPGLVKLLPQLLGLSKVGEEISTQPTGQRPAVFDLMGRPEQARVEKDITNAPEATLRKELRTMMGAEPGTITSDPRANQIIIRDYPEKLDEYARIIKALDKPVKMVKMDIIIVEAGKDFAREVGIGVAGYKSNPAEKSRPFFGTSGTVRDVFEQDYGGTSFTALNLLPLAETAAGTPVSAYGLAGTFLLSGAQTNLIATLSAAETKGISRTVNKSSIITMDNMQAIVEAKTTITYKIQTGGENPTVESRDIDAGIVLNVTPHIIEGEEGRSLIELVVKAERSSFLSTRTDGIPEKATTTLTTQAAIGDEATLVVGGLFEERYAVGETGIPCLMNIPGAGYLFKTASAKDPKSNILFFMSPTIISLDSIPYEGSEVKESVDRREKVLKQIDPEKRKTLIERGRD